MPKETFNNLKNEKKELIIQATIKELSQHPYEHINLANIIRDAKIPRGSFYQYFEDKDDLYMFFILHVAEVKGSFFSDVFDLSSEMPFLERFKKLYLRGFLFAHAYPDLVKAGQFLTSSSLFKNSDLYKNSYVGGLQFFEHLIKKDQDLGIIRHDLDAKFMSKALLNYLNTISPDFYINSSSHMDEIEHNVDQIIAILQKGIENHV